MKYIKMFEDEFNKLNDDKNKYKVGDWVFLNNYWAGQHLREFINNHPAKIISVHHSYEYDLEYLSNPKTDIFGKQYEGKWVLENFDLTRIIRLATPEEIENEIIHDYSNKYNI